MLNNFRSNSVRPFCQLFIYQSMAIDIKMGKEVVLGKRMGANLFQLG
jgi:hypothetical protein